MYKATITIETPDGSAMTLKLDKIPREAIFADDHHHPLRATVVAFEACFDWGDEPDAKERA
jgi:hypothetical protein